MTRGSGRRRGGRRSTRSLERGAVALEVVTCLVPVMILFLCAVQLSFLAVGRMVVGHAAVRGARAAIVLLEEDPRRMGGAPRGDLTAAGAGDARSELGSVLARSLPAGIRPVSSAGGARLRAIADAVHAPLAVLAPGPSTHVFGDATSLYDALGGDGTGGASTRFALGILVHGPAATQVTLRAAPGSSEIVSRVDARGSVTVHVTYLQRCSVPVAARLMCSPAPSGELGRRLSGLLGRAHFATVEAEATLPNQGAAYYSGDEPVTTSPGAPRSFEQHTEALDR